MCSPIYSDNPSNEEIDPKLKKHFIPLLSQETINGINEQLNFKNHGFYIFIQYKEQHYIVNSFSENVFWEMINALYRLLHDCGNEMLETYLQIVQKGGFHALKPFPPTDTEKALKYEDAKTFIKDVENMRIFHFHNMKPDSVVDQSRIKSVEKKFKEISQKNEVPQDSDEWEKCISWIYYNCDQIHKLLAERLLFLEEEATWQQQDFFTENYYICLENFYKRIIYEIIRDVVRKKSRSYNRINIIQSFVNVYENEIIEKALSLIKNSVSRVDPYTAGLEAAETILVQKGKI